MEVRFINIYMSLVCLNALYAPAIAFIHNMRHIRPLNYPYIYKMMLFVFIFYRLINNFFRVYNATKCHFYQVEYECLVISISGSKFLPTLVIE